MIQHPAHARLEAANRAGECLVVIGLDDEVHVIALDRELDDAKVVAHGAHRADHVTDGARDDLPRNDGSPFAARRVMCAGTCWLSDARARWGVLALCALCALCRPAFARKPPRPRRGA